jgi:hypothetical protein
LKETNSYFERDQFILWKRPTHTLKETNSYFERDQFILWKRPTHTLKETNSYFERDQLILWKRPTSRKPQTRASGERSSAYLTVYKLFASLSLHNIKKKIRRIKRQRNFCFFFSYEVK